MTVLELDRIKKVGVVPVFFCAVCQEDHLLTQLGGFLHDEPVCIQQLQLVPLELKSGVRMLAESWSPSKLGGAL